jgi:hypothetical protein
MADHLIDERSYGTPAAAASRLTWMLALIHERFVASAVTLVVSVMLAVVVFAVQAPVLRHYFFGDDVIPLAEAASKDPWTYVRDLLLLHDITPNWRFLTGLVYLALFRAFGLQPVPYLALSVTLHTGTALLLLHLVRRTTGSLWAGAFAGALFGLSAASVPTVGQVTAFNNVLATFLLMLSLVVLYEGLERVRPHVWTAGAALCFAAAIAANESAAVAAPVFGLVLVWRLVAADSAWRDRDRWRRAVLLTAPFAVLGTAALLGFAACRCTEAATVYDTGVRHMLNNLWTYLGRLLYPVGLAFPGHVETSHRIAGLIVVLGSVLLLLRGPAIARISIVFLALGLLPYLPVAFALAPRYVYLASAPFAVLAACAALWIARTLRPYRAVVLPALVVAAFAVLGLSGWQTWEQNRTFGAATEPWRQLTEDLQAQYTDLPAGSTVYVRGGPLTNPLLNFEVLPALGRALWGKAEVRTLSAQESVCFEPDRPLYLVDFVDGTISPVLEVDAAGRVRYRAPDAEPVPPCPPSEAVP